MATTVATNYGNVWLLNESAANVAKWLRDNNILADQILGMVFDDTNSNVIGFVRAGGSDIGTDVS